MVNMYDTGDSRQRLTCKRELSIPLSKSPPLAAIEQSRNEVHILRYTYSNSCLMIIIYGSSVGVIKLFQRLPKKVPELSSQ